MKGNKLDEVTTPVPPNDTLSLVDERFGLEKGTTFKIVKLNCVPTLLNTKLAEASLPIQFGDFGVLPKSQRPAWRALMQELGVDKEHWMDPSLLVESRPIEELLD